MALLSFPDKAVNSMKERKTENGKRKTGQRLKLGVVGVGYLGEFHTQKYASMDNIDLVGLADTNFERAQEMARKYNTKAYNNHTKLLSHVDGLSLAVPTEAHFEIGHDILDHGIHLLIESLSHLS